MLLVVTHRGDLHADWVIAELGRRDIDFLRFNTEDYPLEVGLSWSDSGAASLQVAGRRWLLEDFHAVWYRRPLAPAMAPELAPALRQWAAGESREALLGAWRTLGALWVNHPDRNHVAESKQLQLTTAKRLGLQVPATLVTNQPERARRFVADQATGAVCKPLRDGRLPLGGEEQVFFTSRVDHDDPALDRLGAEPYIFQELVPKRADVRVTVIGDELFAVAIDSQAEADSQVDWRRGAHRRLQHRVVELPDPVAWRCLALCREFDLQFGAIDLAEDLDGEYHFLEINPNGQWAWLEQETGLPLRDRLIGLLGSGGSR